MRKATRPTKITKRPGGTTVSGAGAKAGGKQTSRNEAVENGPPDPLWHSTILCKKKKKLT